MNPRLAEQVRDLTPGHALDLGCGLGGDAIWLAQQGWRVSAVDVAPSALARARELAIDAGGADRISFIPTELLNGLGLDLGQWQVIRADTVERVATGPAGETATVTDTVLRLVRLAPPDEPAAT